MHKSILKKQEILEMAAECKVHFLNPNAVRQNQSLGDHTGITGFGFHRIAIEPGRESTELHRHTFEDECVYILQGVAEVQIGEEQYSVAEGDFIGYPAGGLPHTMKNTGDELLVCIVVGQRLDHDICDYPNKGKRLHRNRGLPWELVDLGDITHPR
ncbi:cupin domain-containing protein [Microbulbifer spongiae]|uniref:Cupin domain-containing protein n=1 Tax=Microbulbifer spongiae TaxID=2944933 RepID=A0ABY9EAX3_9GAMM|nr:cupin domain-containing protein [Microbulbifer sp. MI-G]WKD49312.1 cupin domain-containing protein [Microbulbifer sp. MI-G]